MPLNHSEANVTISVAGIAFSRVYKRNQFEVDFLRCDRHKPMLDIQKITLDPVTRKRISSSLVDHFLSLNEDISIDVRYTDKDGSQHFQRGVTPYLGCEFDRLKNIGDPEDFRWVADLEGPEFHNRKLRVKNLSELKPTIFISNGILYTREKTNETFAKSMVNGPPLTALGKFAHGFNTDITCPVGGEVILSNLSESGLPERGTGYSISLPQSDDTKYMITIDNHCDSDDESEGTDFRLFYDVLEDPDGKQFDLRRIVDTGRYGVPEKILQEQGNFALDGYPQNCLTVTLSGESFKGQPNT
jgi:hypothetical protein